MPTTAKKIINALTGRKKLHDVIKVPSVGKILKRTKTKDIYGRPVEILKTKGAELDIYYIKYAKDPDNRVWAASNNDYGAHFSYLEAKKKIMSHSLFYAGRNDHKIEWDSMS